MGLTSTTQYARRAAERRSMLEGGPLGTEPDWTPGSAADAIERLEVIRAVASALSGVPVPKPSTREERRRWPAGAIELRRAP